MKPPVIIGAVVTDRMVSVIDELARRRGITRSAMLRLLLDNGLDKALETEPELLAAYINAYAPEEAPKKKGPNKVYRFTQ